MKEKRWKKKDEREKMKEKRWKRKDEREKMKEKRGKRKEEREKRKEKRGKRKEEICEWMFLILQGLKNLSGLWDSSFRSEWQILFIPQMQGYFYRL